MSKKPKIDSDLFFGLRLSDEQKELKDAIMGDDYDVIFVNSKAGTGKSTIAVGCAKLLVASGKYTSLEYIFSPCQEDALGFTAGSVAEKESKYLTPLNDALLTINENTNTCFYSDNINQKNGTAWVNAYSHSYMRGGNLRNNIVVIDECQNMTIPELKKILTRCHDSCKVICLGHSGQIDLKKPSLSGFSRYIEHFKDKERCKICNLTHNYRGWIASWSDELIL